MKSSLASFDKKDRLLLYLLDLNGRMSYAQLAKRTLLSKQMVKYRIERLEKRGIITGYYPLIDLSRLGFLSFRVYLKYRSITPERKKKLLAYFQAHKAIWAIVSVAGKWDCALGVGVRTTLEFYALWEELL